MKPNRKCNICRATKPIEEFHLKLNGEIGKSCKKCMETQRKGKVKSQKEVKIILTGNKKCERCGELKDMQKDYKIGQTGRIRKICNDCLWYLDPKSKAKRAKREAIEAPTTPFVPEIDMTKPLDLSFLADLGGFSETEIKRLLLTVNVYTKEPHFYTQVQIFNKFFPHRKPNLCKQIVEEFTEVYRSGLEFEDYIKSGRKYRKDGLKQMGIGKLGKA